MRTSLTVGGLVWMTCVGLAASITSAGLLTIDEAVQLSSQTGRPIFAVAGSAT